MVEDPIATYINRSVEAFGRAAGDRVFLSAAMAIADSLTHSIRTGGKVLIAGNGGSAADAQHIAGELLSRFLRERHPLPAIALSDPAVVTAIGNDYSFERVFERQVRGLGRRGDVFIAISTSGRSRRVLAALKAAREGEFCSRSDLPG